MLYIKRHIRTQNATIKAASKPTINLSAWCRALKWNSNGSAGVLEIEGSGAKTFTVKREMATAEDKMSQSF